MKKRVEALAKKHGATVHDDKLQGIFADLPAGKLWRNTGTHSLAVAYDECSGPKALAWIDLAERMADGVEDGCSDADPMNCDFCNPEPAVTGPTAGEKR